jgi:hypothetical protein
MKPMDWADFEKWIRANGFTVGFSTKHHVILDADGAIVARFAVSHKKGAKRFVKPIYLRQLQALFNTRSRRPSE